MDNADTNTQDFEDFRRGTRNLYIIVGEEDPIPMFRKLDAERVAIIVWKDALAAGKFLTANNLTKSRVMEISYKMAMDYIARWPRPARADAIEIIR